MSENSHNKPGVDGSVIDVYFALHNHRMNYEQFDAWCKKQYEKAYEKGAADAFGVNLVSAFITTNLNSKG